MRTIFCIVVGLIFVSCDPESESVDIIQNSTDLAVTVSLFTQEAVQDISIKKKSEHILERRFNLGSGMWLPPYSLRHDSIVIVFTSNNIMKSEGFTFSDLGRSGGVLTHEYRYDITQEHVDKAE